MSLNVVFGVVPIRVFKQKDAPSSFAPNRPLMRRLSMDCFRRLVFDPFDDVIDVALGVREQEVRVCRLNRCCSDFPIRRSGTVRISLCARRHHFCRMPNRRMRLPLLRHSLPNGIAGMQLVRLDVSQLLVPRIGPMAPLISRQPKSIAGNANVITERARHSKAP